MTHRYTGLYPYVGTVLICRHCVVVLHSPMKLAETGILTQSCLWYVVPSEFVACNPDSGLHPTSYAFILLRLELCIPSAPVVAPALGLSAVQGAGIPVPAGAGSHQQDAARC